jgi:hypothetical protein
MLKELLCFMWTDKWFFLAYSICSYLLIRGVVATVKDLTC